MRTDRSVGSLSASHREAPALHPAPPSSREKILDVAEGLFARSGYAGVGLREVAVAAGLGKSSLFHHFHSKGQLYCEVLARVLARIEERLAPVVSAPGEPAARLRRWIEVLVDVLAEHPTTGRLLLRALVEEDEFDEELPEAQVAERRLTAILGGIRRLLADGVETGAFRRVSIPQTLQTLIGATVYHFASGEFGEGVLGRPLFSADAVRARKDELIRMLEVGLVADAAQH